jgi:hypothetical protein
MQLNAGHRATSAARNPANPDAEHSTSRDADDSTHRNVIMHAAADLQWVRAMPVADGVPVTWGSPATARPTPAPMTTPARTASSPLAD